MNPALERVLRWFFPRRCALCGTVVALDEPLCPDCQKVRPIARPKCLLCGRSKKDCTCRVSAMNTPGSPRLLCIGTAW